MEVLRCLCILWIISVQITSTDQEQRQKRQTASSQPRIVTTDGHLYFQTAENHNITFQSSRGGFVNVDGHNINAIVQMVIDDHSQLQHIQGSSGSSIADRVSSLEQREGGQDQLLQEQRSLLEQQSRLIQQLTERVGNLDGSSSGPVNVSAVSVSQLNRLTRRVQTLEGRLRQLNRNLRRDECRSNPCQHGGTCEDVYSGFVCRCPRAWTGDRCQLDVNECAELAGTDLGCQNGATCTNTEGSFTCMCPPQWHGVRCTETHDDCDGASSQALCGHGTCVNVARVQPGQPKYHCICDAGWTTAPGRPECNVDVDECSIRGAPVCSVNPAVTCINVPGSFYCGACPAGYSGDGHSCYDLDECLVNNGGCSQAPPVHCINTLGSRICGPCPPGYQGDGVTCSYQGSCSQGNGGCHPLATCHEGVGFSGRSCQCPSGYAGSGVGPNGCVQTISGGSTSGACANNPCLHGACQTRGSSGYQCVCVLGWTGSTCSQNVNECASAPCANGGVCVDGVNSYICQCTSDFTGPNCEHSQQSCGGHLTEESGSLRYPPQVGQAYPHAASCAWVITTAPNKIIQLSFSSFKLEQHVDCEYDFVEIHDGDSASAYTLARFCGSSTPPALNSTRNQVYIWFKSDASTNADGFELHWTSAPPVCGGNLRGSDHGVITSPGYPGDYPHNRDCVWTVAVDPDKKILFTLGRIAIEHHSNCSYDYLEIRDGLRESDPMLGSRICSTQDPAPLTTTGPYAEIRFHSDDTRSDTGFQISYMAVPGTPGCGGNFTAASGVLISPNYPNPYPHDSQCVWVIWVPDGERISLNFTDVDLEEHASCQWDYIELRDGADETAPFVGRYCSDIPPVYVSSSNSLWIRMRADTSNRGRGFRATWDVECGGTFTAPSGLLTSPYFPEPYPNDKSCEYIISQPEGTIITLTFITVGIEASLAEGCQHDYLEIRDGDDANSPLLQRLCGTTIPSSIVSTSNYVWLKFESDGSIQNHGFKLRYSTGMTSTGGGGDITEGEAACGGSLTSNTGAFSSPAHPNSYPHGVNCTWYISVDPGLVVRLTFSTFHLESHPRCSYDSVVVYDNNTSVGEIGRFCGNHLPPVLTSSDSFLTVVFSSDASVAEEGFAASYVALNASTVCGTELRETTGVISSPNYPENYPHNRVCEWVIVMPAGSQVLLNITDFSLERHAGCNYDYLEIRNGGYSTSPLIGEYCGTTVDPIIRSHSNRLYLKFTSDGSMSERGFQAYYDGTLSGCGGELTGTSGSFVSPNYPQMYGHNAECFWTITVSRGSRVHLDFVDFDIETHDQCNYDYIEVRDRDVSGAFLGKFCGNTIPPSITSLSNKMYVKFRTDYSSGGRGFHAAYHADCNVRLTDYRGVIESPNFPEPYPHHRNCTWVIEATLGNTINASFSHFFMEDHSNCTYDFVELRDGEMSSSPLIGKYCGTNFLPPFITTESQYLYVRFEADVSVAQDGFRLEYVMDGCGGDLRGSTGTLSSPGYPQAYPFQRECVWTISTAVGTRIELNITDFDVEAHPTCNYDVLQIYGGMGSSSPLLSELCHSQTSPQIFTATGNHLYVRFVSDESQSGRGFSATYRTLPDGCGGSFSTAKGSIMSPNYPSLYPPRADCLWSITMPEGRSVLLTFEDFEIEAHDDCQYDYVGVYDSEDFNNTQLLRACGSVVPAPIRSADNTLFVRMRTDESQVHKGFKANFEISCGGSVNAESDGVITSPGYPENYGKLSNCTWYIQGEHPDDKITLTFTHLDVEPAGNCTHDYVEVLDGNDINAPLVGRYCGNTVPSPLTSNGAALVVNFISDSMLEMSGFRAVYTKSTSGCGGEFTAEHGSFNSPGYPDTYPHNVECVWEIKTSPGQRIAVAFSVFNLEDEELCNHDYVEIREGGSAGSVLGRYCGNTLPLNITTGSNLWIKFKSNEDTPGVGFMASYNTLYGGDLFGNTGQLASPMYPNNYPHNGHYEWTITVDAGMRIRLTFTTLDIEVADDCVYDYVKIQNGGQWDAAEIGRYCGTVPPEPIITSGNQVRVTFHTDYAANGQGFLINWEATTDIAAPPTPPPYSNTTEAECEFRLVASSTPQTVSSPGYPNGYASSLDCTWWISAPAGYRVLLNMTDVDLESHGNCNYDRVTVYESAPAMVGHRFCNNRNLVPITSRGSIMKLRFTTDSSVNKTGFSATFNTVCGGIITNMAVGNIVSPSFPSEYPANSNCTWQIGVSPGRTVSATFNTININQGTGTQCADYVQIFNGESTSSPELGRFCGTTVPDVISTSSNKLTVTFMSDSYGAATGFNLTFQEVAVACGGHVELTDSVTQGFLTSPNYPENYPVNVDCVWIVTAPANHRIQLDFVDEFNIEPHRGCEYDYVQVRDGGTSNSDLLAQVCGTELPNTQRATGNVLYVRFRTDDSVTHTGFRAKYSIGGCGGIFSGQSGVIQSPEYPSNYKNNMDCEWQLKAPTGHFIMLSFVSFELERDGNCSAVDFLEIRDLNATGPLLGQYCGENAPTTLNTSDSFAFLRFHSNAQNTFAGFQINWEASVEECGGLLTTPTGAFTSPNYPGLYAHRRRCVWHIVVAEGRRVTLTFSDFNLEQHSNCAYDTVWVFNGNTPGSPVLPPGRLCGSEIPGPFESSGNAMAVLFRSDGSVSSGGFAASYTSLEEAVCGGRITDGQSGMISSPGFGDSENYNNSLNCLWTIRNPAIVNASISLRFSAFDIESHGECRYDYVEILEGSLDSSELVGRYCGNETLPPYISSPVNVVTVRFISDIMLNRQGFQLQYEFEGCGGVVTDPQGVITSKNFPNNYGHSDSCAWKIVAPEGNQIRLHFSDFAIEQHDSCAYDYVEVFNGGLPTSPSLGRYCGTTPPADILSQSNQVRIEFHSDDSSAARGFKLQYEFDGAGCGGLYHSLDGSIKSPNWPSAYPADSECIWDVVAQPGYHLTFNFTAPFDMQIQNVCEQDYVELFDWSDSTDYTSLGRFCGNHIPSPVQTTSFKAKVKFRSNADIQGNGFKVNYTAGCGAIFESSEGMVMSPGYPNNYGDNMICNYTIIPDDLQATVILTFDDIFRVEALDVTAYYYFYPNGTIPTDNPGFFCRYDVLYVYEGNDTENQVGMYCGYMPPQPLAVRGIVHLQFRTDATVTDKGWKLYWRSEGCGGEFSDPSGVIQTPAHPTQYRSNSNCTWLITVQPNRVVDFKFNFIDIEAHSRCQYDYALLYDGPTMDSPIIGRFCGQVVPTESIRSTNNSLLVQFVSDASVTGAGFTAAYRETYGESAGCGGLFLNATTGQIQSVNADSSSNYADDLDCVWRIVASPNDVVNIHFSSFRLESSVDCNRYDYVKIYDGLLVTDPLVGTYCGRNTPPDFTSSSNNLMVHFKTDSGMAYTGFRANFTTAPALCGGTRTVTSEPQNLTSPNYPGTYPANMRCRWMLDAPEYAQIQISFLHLDIEDHSSCSYDYLQIRDVPMADYGQSLHYCGSVVPAQPFISLGRTVQLNLVTDFSSHGTGFLVEYSLASCNRSMLSDNGRITSPGWPGNYPTNAHCVVEVMAPAGSQLSFFFNSFHIEPHSSCNYDYLQVAGGNSTRRVCGATLPDPVFLSTNMATLTLITDSSITHSGYDITYTSSPTGCGGNLTGDHGSFTSPGYPGNYTQTSTCSWTITVPPRKRPTLTFVDFQVGSEDNCSENNVMVYNGGSTSARRTGPYCGSEIPAQFTGTDRVILVVYTSSTSNTGNGFKATYSTAER